MDRQTPSEGRLPSYFATLLVRSAECTEGDLVATRSYARFIEQLVDSPRGTSMLDHQSSRCFASRHR